MRTNELLTSMLEEFKAVQSAVEEIREEVASVKGLMESREMEKAAEAVKVKEEVIVIDEEECMEIGKDPETQKTVA